jgi:hypothetical protein
MEQVAQEVIEMQAPLPTYTKEVVSKKVSEVFREGTVQVEEFAYSFRASKKKNEDGSVTEVPARPTVTVYAPVPTLAGLTDIINRGGKGLALILELAADVIYNNVKERVQDTSFDPETLDLATLDFESIAAIPREDGRKGIDKDRWEAFKKDYIQVMVTNVGLPSGKVETAAKLFVAKLAPVALNPKMLEKLQEYLAVYTEKSADPDMGIVELLNSKLKEFMASATDPDSII